MLGGLLSNYEDEENETREIEIIIKKKDKEEKTEKKNEIKEEKKIEKKNVEIKTDNKKRQLGDVNEEKGILLLIYIKKLNF